MFYACDGWLKLKLILSTCVALAGMAWLFIR